MRQELSAVRHSVDLPSSGETVCAAGFTISGWAYREDGGRLREVRALVAGATVGRTRVFSCRPDVNAAHGLEDDARTGFAVYVEGLPLGAATEIVLVAYFGSGVELLEILPVRVSAFDAAREHYGSLASPRFDHVLHRDDIYSVGPPSPVANEECVELIVGLTEESDAIVDVGCGIGAYARPLLAAGRSWHGCEVVPEFVAAMRKRDLTVTQATGTSLPFEDASFDVSISIEVLEHIDDFASFVAELARVSRRCALLSVPNAGAIPRFAPLGVVPWHLLEGSHVNFFTASSLRATLARSFARVEVIEYGELVTRTIDGTRVYNHLFAIASHAGDDAG